MALNPDYSNDPEWQAIYNRLQKRHPNLRGGAIASKADDEYRVVLLRRAAHAEGKDGFVEGTTGINGVEVVVPVGGGSDETINRNDPSRPTTQEKVAPSASFPEDDLSGLQQRTAPERAPAQAAAQRPPEPSPPTIDRTAPGRGKSDPEFDAALAGLGPPSPLTTSPEVQASILRATGGNSELDSALSLWKTQGLRAGLIKKQEEREEAEKKERAKQLARQAAPYKPQYYSGSQAQIYFQDVLIDEIVNIQYTTVTNKTPIYGYASELFDTVASGNLLVQGTFTINFIEASYLSIVAVAIAERTFGEKAFGRLAPDLRGNGDLNKFGHLNINGPGGRAGGIVSDGSEQVINDILGRDVSGANIMRAGSYMGQQVVNHVKGLPNEEFRKISRTSDLNKIGKDGTFSGSNGVGLPGGNRLPSRFDLIPPFDIYGVFGDYTDASSDHTVRKLKNVYLTGQAQTVISSGENILESYTFIARSLE